MKTGIQVGGAIDKPTADVASELIMDTLSSNNAEAVKVAALKTVRALITPASVSYCNLSGIDVTDNSPGEQA